MDLMTSAGPTANSVFVMAPHNGHPVIPEIMSQVPLYSLTQPQVHQISGNPPGLEPTVSMQPAQRSFKEAKVLGAIQILIGLIHIGLGSIIGMIVSWYYYYTVVSFYGGYPFWGGILISNINCPAIHHFRIPLSGIRTATKIFFPGWPGPTPDEIYLKTPYEPESWCIRACHIPEQLRSSMGLSIASAICSLFRIMLLITDTAFGVATSAMMFIFSLLEFFIACTSAHFGCKLVRYSHNNGTVVFQTVYVTKPVAHPEPVNSPPSYSSDVQDYK